MRSSITWQSIEAEALRRLQSGDWAPGTRIPDEATLARELGCARSTVNRALRELAAAGLLERRRKGGTRVPLTPVRKATFEIPIIRKDIEARGQTPGYRLLSRRIAPLPRATARRLRVPAPRDFMHLTALHLADAHPFCLEDRWINPATPGLAEADFTAISANEWLVRNALFTRGEIAFLAVNADADTAARLGCPPGTALFRIERTTWATLAPVTAVTLTYAPGHRIETAI